MSEELKEEKIPVVDCHVNDVITHSEDEKPLDCEMKKKPLEKPLTEDYEDFNAWYDSLSDADKAKLDNLADELELPLYSECTEGDLAQLHDLFINKSLTENKDDLDDFAISKLIDEFTPEHSEDFEDYFELDFPDPDDKEAPDELDNVEE